MRVLISAGGTGGHIYPALAVANELQRRVDDIDIRFIGALGRMEMYRVPKAGYPIDGLPIMGLQRRQVWKNIKFPARLLQSLRTADKMIRAFDPDVAAGFGGYASGPALYQASRRGIPCLIQEQNSYAGLTNKLLARRVDRICVAYPGMDNYFPAEKITLTGNPVRKDIGQSIDREAAWRHFGLRPDKPTVLVIGGSLGARTLNRAMEAAADRIPERAYQWLWQVGTLYEDAYAQGATASQDQVIAQAYIDRMDYAYAAADLIISRAGALSVSELCMAGRASILVPSPNVAEDHQTHNARSLVDRGAADLLPDADCQEMLLERVDQWMQDEAGRVALARKAKELARPQATDDIAKIILSMASESKYQN